MDGSTPRTSLRDATDQFSVVKLGTGYLEQCVDIRTRNHKDIDGKPLAFNGIFRYWLSHRYLIDEEDQLTHGWGLVHQPTNTLCSFMLTKQIPEENCWVAQLVISDQHLDTSLPVNGLGVVLDHVIDVMENVGLCTYYTVVPLERNRAHERLWDQISKRKKDRYKSRAIETVSAGAKASRPFLNHHIVENDVYPYPYAIREMKKFGTS